MVGAIVLVVKIITFAQESSLTGSFGNIWKRCFILLTVNPEKIQPKQKSDSGDFPHHKVWELSRISFFA